MKNKYLKLESPKYNDRVIYNLCGDYNDADYTYCTISSNAESFEIVMLALQECSGRNFEDSDPCEIGTRLLKEHGIEESEEGIYNDVLYALDGISLYGDNGGCHSMTIEKVYFESKSDNIRYIVKY